MIPKPGLLLADWDESKGPVVIETLLPDITEPPEVLAAQMYVSAQNVFSSEQFSEISFCLPLLKIKRKVKIFFNYVEDHTVRGGRRPFIFCIFLDLDTRDTTFELFDEFIEGQIDKYRKGTLPDLKAIQLQIIEQLMEAPNLFQDPRSEGQKANESSLSDLTILKVFCEKCRKVIRIPIVKEELREQGRVPYTKIHLHGEKSPLERHGFKLKLDMDFSLLNLTYIDGEGHIDTSMENETNRQKLRYKVGPWQPEEIAILKAEMAKGTPSHRLARLLSRTIRDVEGKMEKVK